MPSTTQIWIKIEEKIEEKIESGKLKWILVGLLSGCRIPTVKIAQGQGQSIIVNRSCKIGNQSRIYGLKLVVEAKYNQEIVILRLVIT